MVLCGLGLSVCCYILFYKSRNAKTPLLWKCKKYQEKKIRHSQINFCFNLIFHERQFFHSAGQKIKQQELWKWIFSFLPFDGKASRFSVICVLRTVASKISTWLKTQEPFSSVIRNYYFKKRAHKKSYLSEQSENKMLFPHWQHYRLRFTSEDGTAEGAWCD